MPSAPSRPWTAVVMFLYGSFAAWFVAFVIFSEARACRRIAGRPQWLRFDRPEYRPRPRILAGFGPTVRRGPRFPVLGAGLIMGLLVVLLAASGMSLVVHPSARSGAAFGVTAAAATLTKPLVLLYPFVFLAAAAWHWRKARTLRRQPLIGSDTALACLSGSAPLEPSASVGHRRRIQRHQQQLVPANFFGVTSMSKRSTPCCARISAQGDQARSGTLRRIPTKSVSSGRAEAHSTGSYPMRRVTIHLSIRPPQAFRAVPSWRSKKIVLRAQRSADRAFTGGGSTLVERLFKRRAQSSDEPRSDAA